MPGTRRFVAVQVTARRYSMKFPGRRRPEHSFPHVALGAGFPKRCQGAYRVPQEELMGVYWLDGDPLIDQLDGWIAKGYKIEPRPGRRA
jgi:hypothetical protein